MMLLFTLYSGFAQTSIKIVPHSLCTQLIKERLGRMAQKYSRAFGKGQLEFFKCITDNTQTEWPQNY